MKTRSQAKLENHEVPVDEPADEDSESEGEDDEDELGPIDANFVSRDGRHSGTLTTVLGVEQYPPYEGCIRLEAGLELVLEGKKKGKGKKKRKQARVDPGYIVGWLVDKSRLTDKGKPWWIKELLNTDTQDNDATGELREVIRKLYRKDGSPRTIGSLKDHHDALMQRRIVLIDTVWMYDGWRRTGLSQLALRSFQQLLEDDAMEMTTFVLSPARSDGSDWGNLSDIEVEEALIRFYTREDYEVWILGARNQAGSMTVMGRIERDE